MENLKDYLEERLGETEESYDYWLSKLDQTYQENEIRAIENRLRELRIEKNTLKDIMEKINEDENKNMVSD